MRNTSNHSTSNIKVLPNYKIKKNSDSREIIGGYFKPGLPENPDEIQLWSDGKL
jgi:hypothetical protein